MRGAPLAFAALLFLGACGGSRSIAEVDLLVAVDAASRSVATGEGFLLTVTRIWRKDIEPSPWDDGVLSPLVVRAEDVQTREDRLRVEEVRTFRAYAFGLESVTVPPVLCVGRSVGGSGRVLARSEALEIEVTPTLPPENPGVPELPTVPARQSRAGVWAAALILGLLLALAGYGVLRRRRAHRAAEPELDPLSRVRAELRALVGAGGDGALALSAGSDCVRRAVAVCGGLPTSTRTTEELLPVVPARWRATLGDVLRPADLSKFAGWDPDTPSRRRLLREMLAFVESLEGPPCSGGGA